MGQNIIEPGGYFSAQYGTTSWPACGEIDIVECGIFPSQPSNYFASAIHTASSSGSTINKGGRLANNLGTDFHVYSMNWSPNQITFLLDNVAYYTYNPSIKNASTWPFNNPQYILLNIAMGGVAGSVPNTFTQASMEIDYVRIYQKQDSIPKDTVKQDTIRKDTLPPQNLTARIGNISSTAIELIVSAEDTSTLLQYSINYNSAALVTNGLSKIEKSIKLYNLNPNTDYPIEISVKDSAGNQTTPVIINTKTLPIPSCSGNSNAALQGSFSNGYSYFFDPFGDELIIQYNLLDTDKTGVVGFLLTKSPSNEYAASYNAGNKFTFIQKGISAGSAQDYAVKFAFAGGNTVSNYFNYTLGQKCSTENLSISANSFSAIQFQNPLDHQLQLRSNEIIDELTLYNSMGKIVFQAKEVMNQPLDIRLVPTGIYQMLLRTKNQIKTFKLVKN